MKIKKAIVYGLIDCENCNRIKNFLQLNKIDYSFVDCRDKREKDKITKVSGAYDLPLVYLEEANILLYLSLNYSKSSETRELSNGMRGMAVLSLNEMEHTISLYKYI